MGGLPDWPYARERPGQPAFVTVGGKLLLFAG
jgi:hypothetical protein